MNLLGSTSLLILPKHSLEAYVRTGDANRPVLGRSQRHVLRCIEGNHVDLYFTRLVRPNLRPDDCTPRVVVILEATLVRRRAPVGKFVDTANISKLSVKGLNHQGYLGGKPLPILV